MKIELVRSVSFDELNETFFYTKAENDVDEFSRRKFLKTLVVGSSGLLVPVGLTGQAKAAFPIALLIPAAVSALMFFYRNANGGPVPVVINNNNNYNQPTVSQKQTDDINCTVHLVNDEKHTAKGLMECKLKHRLEHDLAYETISTKKPKVEIQAGQTNEYRVSLGNSSGERGHYEFGSKTGKNKRKMKYKVSS